MPTDGGLSRLATEVFDNCLGIESGDRVWIKSWDHALDLAKTLASECARRSCPYMLSVRHEDVWLKSIMHGSKKQLGIVTPQEEAVLKESDFYVFTMGPRSPVPWTSIPKEKRGEVSVWLDTRYDKSAYARRWARIAKTRRVKMLAIEATLSTPERAKALGLNSSEWCRVMLQGCLVDHIVIARRAKKLARVLSRRSRVTVTSRAGTRLSFDLDRRPIGVSDGVSTAQMAEEGRIVFLPAGAVETSVDEKSGAGIVVFDAPVRVGSRIVRNLRMIVNDGRIIRHTAAQGSEAFEEYLKQGGTNAGRFSYFGFGLNPNLKHGFTQDDKVLGGLTLGFGNNKSMGGKNLAKDQWWASLIGATVTMEDYLMLDRGRLAARLFHRA